MKTVTASTPIEPVGEALHYLRMSGAFYCRSELTAPFGMDVPPMENTLIFHLPAAGRCWVEVDEEEPVLVQPGDLSLVPHGRGHRLVSEPGFACTDLFEMERELVSERYEQLRHGGGGALTTMLCGAVRFDHPAAIQLVQLLPNVLHVNSWTTLEAEWLQSTLRFIAAEAQEMRLGGETIITRLCDVVVIQAIRSWVRTASAAQTGWLGALQDEQVGRALAAVHREPKRTWTVKELADACFMSRSAFSARFTELVGEPPMAYVTRFRMNVAASWLRDGEDSVAAVAHRMGYQSEAAFSRAFKRSTGTTPGAMRRAAG